MSDYTQIGKEIYATLKGLVNNRVYPLVAEQTTSFPFIIYHTSASRPVSEKDRTYCDWEFTITIDVVDNSYDNVIQLCDDALDELYKLDEHYDVTVNSINELYQDDAYVREIEITIKK